MGRVKNYLRYAHEDSFGIIAASQAGVGIKLLPMRDTQDRFIAVPASENVYFWDLKTKQIINRLSYDDTNSAEVTALECHYGGHPRTNLIAVGYANGRVRVFEYETGYHKTTFTGHRSAVTALAFDKDGSRLASGGKDTNIAIWDIEGEKGLFSLKGHKNSISKLAFLYNEQFQKDLLISSSTDAVSTIKFWDLTVQHCFYTIPGQANGVWSFIILKNGTRLVTGSNGPELRIYSINFMSDTEIATGKNKNELEAEENVDSGFLSSEAEYGLRVRHLGNILRNSTSISNRVQDIVVDKEESLMICYSSDKSIELYKLRSAPEALTYARKQAKKQARKSVKRRLANDEGDEQTKEPDAEDNQATRINSIDELDPQAIVNCEFNTKIAPRRLRHRVKALSMFRMRGGSGNKRYKLVVVSASNRIDGYEMEPESTDPENEFRHILSIESGGHRSDVRSVSVSSDNRMIMSASGESVKIWNIDSKFCTTTVYTDHVQCCIFSNAQNLTGAYDNRFVIAGTKTGQLQILDISSAQVIETLQISEDDKPINAICNLPDCSGIVCGGEDQALRFFSYTWTTKEDEGQKITQLSLVEDRSMKFQEGITALRVSSDGRLFAVALLDSTVRIHFMDTLKYFLTMYGHKFPVTTMDISDDNTLIVTGSADKNIKIWGLDFGDCHKSIFAHDDIVSCVRFIPKTHYIFSCSRDKTIKQWDCDHFIKIQTLKKHQAEVWSLDVSANGKYVATCSHDKSMRLYRKTEEIVVPREEDEMEHEEEDERNVYEKQENIVPGDVNKESGVASKMTVEIIKSVDRLIEALEVFNSEEMKERDYMEQCMLAQSKGLPKPPEPEHDPLLMTAMTTDYNRFMLEVLRRVKSSELDQILLFLPFDFVHKLLIITAKFLEKRWDIELMIRIATFLLKVNFGQIAASPIMMPVVHRLRKTIIERATHLRDCSGFNLIALDHLGRDKTYLNVSSRDTR